MEGFRSRLPEGAKQRVPVARDGPRIPPGFGFRAACEAKAVEFATTGLIVKTQPDGVGHRFCHHAHHRSALAAIDSCVTIRNAPTSVARNSGRE